MKPKIKTYLVALVLPLVAMIVPAGAAELPQFLPSYYSPAFDVGPQNLVFVSHKDVNGVESIFYATRDSSIGLGIENMKCDLATAGVVYDNLLMSFNDRIKEKSGKFVEITASESCVEIIEDGFRKLLLVYVLPASVQVWTYMVPETSTERFDSKYEQVRGFADKQRFKRASYSGNVDMGHWGFHIYRYAKQLLQDGKKQEAVDILEKHLATTPFHYEAHVDFMNNTDDSKAAANSAEIVLKNAESRELLEQSAKYLAKDIPDINSIPLLDEKETGLQLILIPLPPCNPWFLDDAAKTFRQITDVPVKIRRLKEDWKWDSPDRISQQRMVQATLVGWKNENIDFTGWTKQTYIEQLQQVSEKEDPITQYKVNAFIDWLRDERGQYLIDSYLTRFRGILAAHRSIDIRTMYVGITEKNIYSGDNNFLFSLGTTAGESRASILSYYMMLAENLGQYQSRQRLTERIAKELVPAAFKQLNIPRSTDPTCPYSYSAGVDRLDEKTLILSDQVKRELQKFKKPTPF